MRKMAKYAIVLAAIGLLIAGCQDGPAPVAPETQTMPPLALFSLPDGAVFQSATVFVYASVPNNQTVNIHRITNPWDETVVTWNNFGSSYDPTIVGSFLNDVAGWHSVDITTLVEDWLDGTYANYGILMDQGTKNYPRAQYWTREAFNFHPYMEICYELNGETVCENIEADADTYVYELWPDFNDGLSNQMYTGWLVENDREKQALLFFDIEYTPDQEGCSLTIGYWKTHAGFGPQPDVVTPLLPIWLGDAGGTKSLFVDTALMAYNILVMKTYGDESNGITKLYAQLLGVKLNIANGADDMDVAAAIVEADAFLADYDWNDWGGLTEEEQEWVLDLKDMFDDYNNGDIGPGHCED